MRFICPACPDSDTIEVPDDSEDAICPRCLSRYRLSEVFAERISASPRGNGLLYTLYFQKGGRPKLERFSSKYELPIQRGHQFIVVRRGRRVVGLADQTRNYWFPVFADEYERPLLRSLLISLIWPISLLVVLQSVRLPQAVLSLLQDPLGLALGICVLSLLSGAPLLLWTMRTLFPYGPGRERIRGFDPRL
jgi:hypothetical protein